MAENGVQIVTDANFTKAVLECSTPVVVDFWAEWCGPCKMLTPIVTALSAEFSGKVTFGKVNIDDNPQIAAKYGIISIPTLLFFNQGKIVDQHTGLLPQATLKNRVNKIFAIA